MQQDKDFERAITDIEKSVENYQNPVEYTPVENYEDPAINSKYEQLYDAIQKGNIARVEKLLDERKSLVNQKRDFTRHQETGELHFEYAELLMLGQLPLSMAALTFSSQMVDSLLKYGADIFGTNDYGDTVFHSIVKYAGYYHDKIPTAIVIMKHLVQEMKKKIEPNAEGWYETPFHTRNIEAQTVLQIALNYELHEIFTFILNLDGIYCVVFDNPSSYGKIYDVTELDVLTNFNKNTKTADNCFNVDMKRKFYPSVSEMLFKEGISSSVSTALVDSEPLKSLISATWYQYVAFFYVWMFFYFSYLIGATVFCILRRDIYFTNNEIKSLSEMNEDLEHNTLLLVFFFFCSFIGLIPVVALFYTRHLVKRISIHYVFHNIDTIVLYALFNIFIFFDTCGVLSNTRYRGFFMTLALPCGWGFAIILFRAIERFAYFTVLIRKVIVGDLLSFMVVMGVIFIAFTASLHDLMKYSTDENTQEVSQDANFSNFWISIYSLFLVYLGIKDVENLSEARIYALAYFLYTVFIIMSHILLLNALLALMSNTCSRIYDSRKALGLKQKLSIMILMEEMFALHLYFSPIGDPSKSEVEFFTDRRYLSFRLDKVKTRRPKTNVEQKLFELQQMVGKVLSKS